MWRRPLVILLLITACAPRSGVTTPSTAASATTSPVTGAPVTSAGAEMSLIVNDCSAPPVTFSALCEVFELVQSWHVDRPIDASVLAEAATEAVETYDGDEVAEPPRTLFCATPHHDFLEFCDALARVVREHSYDIGPVVDAAVTAMTEQGLDPFSYYVPPGEVAAFRSNGVVEGVGVLLDARDAVGSRCARIGTSCRLEIVFVLEDNPGAAAGLRSGDVVVSVDGVGVEGQSFSATAAAMAGDETGTVQITVDRDGELVEFDIERATLSVPTVEVAITDYGVGYIRIPDFEADIPELVDEALLELFELSPETVVVDLRDNPGGFVDSAIAVADEFIDVGPVMVSDAPGEHLEYPATPGGLATSGRVVVVVNQGTASAAEILALALRDRRDAIIVGVPTFGKDAVQIPFKLRNGGEFYVAVAHWTSPTGSTVGGGGITPDRLVEIDQQMTAEEVVATATSDTP